ncbi:MULTISPECIES: UDP-N-acetylmuramoyl-L-alanyl-D-glutamate--2,6-diaminopimelate ligase [Chelativorans]|jgi:UDP-N-acetylmuramoyl-L-alanyl-D-glutamate--2,6-diaminopimelate ligase|uniref:UDP-N-acetylmuramoyl-L-alanyl-D-glutamate--2,6-diaminopimelate ligase n=1 Tax=Chelativorans sp. (strain BNC1) TaxID=266779 RepID=MURE_CHESB|nr:MULTISPECIES: UDP-N-acetylmuramoyl-L-alanyl-D-glutamate--2,6-diaminopimelate ligase [Chelativorans]Q11GS0.1 RecName: Full=UDP-N-acetylmuramoyl-L-alanyl-D-glutamate--2,6-diaminopimelate ligase; AltName: Full=Meso-A2pm-adding enzyme; AltName: Full=Meso-diaminopimelate-adding enzyme; AltName: Full=UDP-MurNAc-L-Ala-D-Glu:meso-diaminopimelate ligase; AltName: Full=UDP-MurNAc-tripeptide synthetase; AltName: Full=UDP-N-acetylmuramyl-tripeptide synthetase [Chelativorans sp. BNC1]
MKLGEFADILPLSGSIAGETTISGLASDSRRVNAGDLFFALQGSKADGAAYAADAAGRGAVAIIARPGTVGDVGVPVIEADDPRHVLALASARLYGAQPATMVAVTGTSGKTSVAAFTRQIWEKAGLAAASIGTTGVVAPGRDEYGELTTPDPVSLHKLLRELADAGVTHASMEASSHGLDQRRLDGVKLAAGGFTNLGRDHMDYHPTVEHYHQSKMRLFKTLLPKGAPAVIFADDPWSEPTEKVALAAGLQLLTVGRRGTFLTIKRVEHERHRQRTEIEHEGMIYDIMLPLAGDFQVGNALVAAGLAISTGLPADKAVAALEHLKGASGRLELTGTTEDGAQIYVDYAHKPDALENVLQAVRPFTTGRVIVVFGCGGDRDPGKRPIMGEIARRLADVVIVTDDNPRSEVPAEIRRAILEAVPEATEIGDRREAIRTAVAMLNSGDTLIVAGKGHEIGQEIAGTKLPFSDHEEVRRALKERTA